MSLQPFREALLAMQRAARSNRDSASSHPDNSGTRWLNGRADAFEQAAAWLADALTRAEATGTAPLTCTPFPAQQIDDDDADIRLCPDGMASE